MLILGPFARSVNVTFVMTSWQISTAGSGAKVTFLSLVRYLAGCNACVAPRRARTPTEQPPGRRRYTFRRNLRTIGNSWARPFRTEFSDGSSEGQLLLFIPELSAVGAGPDFIVTGGNYNLGGAAQIVADFDAGYVGAK